MCKILLIGPRSRHPGGDLKENQVAITEIKIEKNVPIAGVCIQARSSLSIVFQQMEVGDSIVIKKTRVSTVYSTARYLNRKVTVRSLGDGNVRVWRVEDK